MSSGKATGPTHNHWASVLLLRFLKHVFDVEPVRSEAYPIVRFDVQGTTWSAEEKLVPQ